MRAITLQRVFCLLILFLVDTFVASAANTIKVPANQPTIQDAINAASTGDTVLVAPGTYYENLVIDAKEITLTSEQGAATTTIDGGQKGTVLTIKNTPSLATTISGFTLQNGLSGNYQIAGGIYVVKAGATISSMTLDRSNFGQIFVRDGSITLTSSVVSNGPVSTTQCQTDVIQLFGVSTVVNANGVLAPTQILGNLIEGDGTYCSGLAIRGNAGDLVVANNTIRYNEFGISAYPTGLTVRQNLIYGNFSGALFIGHPFVTGPETDPADFFVVNNTLFNNVSPQANGSIGAVLLDAEYAKIAFINNIIAENSSVPVLQCLSPPNYTPVILDHNDIYNTLGPITDKVCPTPTPADGNISAAPSFVSSTDFHLPPGSPAIDAGNNSAPTIPSTDLANNPRIQDNTGLGYGVIDMGTYESAGAQNATTSVLALTSSSYYLPPGSITLTAALLPQNSPSRSVSFYQDGNFLSSGVLTPSAPFSININLTKPGVYSFIAKLDAAPGFSPAVSVVIYVYVTQPATSPSTTTLVATPNPAYALQPITLTATVSGTGTTTPTGTVTFYDGTATLGSAPLDNSGHAAFTTVPAMGLTAGTHLLKATYSGDSTYASSTSPTFTETIQINPVSLAANITPSPATAFQLVTLNLQVTSLSPVPISQMCTVCSFTVNVTGPSAVPPDPTTVDVASHNGVNGLQYVVSNTGTYTFTVTFNGGSFFASSTATVPLTVGIAPLTLGLTASPTIADQHQTVTLTARITAPNSIATPVGAVVFSDGSTSFASVPIPASLASNSATVIATTASLTPGTHTITASYRGLPDYSPTVSAPVTVTINPLDYTVTTSNPAITIKTEHHLAIKVNLASIGGFTDKIALNCANLPPHASCYFDKNSLLLLPDGTATTDLTIDTDDVRGYARNESPRRPNSISFALLLPTGVLLLATARRRRSILRLLLLLSTIGSLALTLNGCSGLYPKSTAPGVYTINITGAGATTGLQHTQPITLTVTP
jgi:hypothetical protein